MNAHRCFTGTIKDLKLHYSDDGEIAASFNVITENRLVRCVSWEQCYNKYKHLIFENSEVLVRGDADGATTIVADIIISPRRNECSTLC